MADEELPVISSGSTPEKDDTDRKKLDGLISNLAEDYTKYLQVNIVSEKSALDDEIEDILTRLDEFTSLVDMVRGDNALCLDTTLPEIFKKCEGMEKMFITVDKLEQMVHAIKQNLDAVEEKVTEAEENLDSSSVKKLFNSLQKPLFSKKGAESKKQMKYDPPKIFKTEDFFKNQSMSSTTDEEKTPIPASE